MMLALNALLAMVITLTLTDASSFNPNDVSTWLSYDISNLESESIKSLVQKASTEFTSTGSFTIPQFLKPNLRDIIATPLQSIKHIPRIVTRTVFQDKGDFVNFDASSHYEHNRIIYK